ncbi:hypothetical protein P389DRAFT_197314 [Cystobasidium minutum MCA 4210]|uniref:uncharacterized protein n=1 Tax=Cystobasidium minutum MCA 4210 TaxID=1397322 RepID=UPI0034CE7F71|eukprot:jgi/Rhomi1/197314/gm1.5528_g
MDGSNNKAFNNDKRAVKCKKCHGTGMVLFNSPGPPGDDGDEDADHWHQLRDNARRATRRQRTRARARGSSAPVELMNADAPGSILDSAMAMTSPAAVAAAASPASRDHHHDGSSLSRPRQAPYPTSTYSPSSSAASRDHLQQQQHPQQAISIPYGNEASHHPKHHHQQHEHQQHQHQHHSTSITTTYNHHHDGDDVGNVARPERHGLTGNTERQPLSRSHEREKSRSSVTVTVEQEEEKMKEEDAEEDGEGEEEEQDQLHKSTSSLHRASPPPPPPSSPHRRQQQGLAQPQHQHQHRYHPQQAFDTAARASNSNRSSPSLTAASSQNGSDGIGNTRIFGAGQSTGSGSASGSSYASSNTSTISGAHGRSHSISRPKLPPIKQLLDDIDDWPQARIGRASSSIRSASPVLTLDGYPTPLSMTPDPAHTHKGPSSRETTGLGNNIFAKPGVPLSMNATATPRFPANSTSANATASSSSGLTGSPAYAHPNTSFRPYRPELERDLPRYATSSSSTEAGSSAKGSTSKASASTSGPSSSSSASASASASISAFGGSSSASASASTSQIPQSHFDDRHVHGPAKKRARRQGSDTIPRERLDGLSLQATAGNSHSYTYSSPQQLPEDQSPHHSPHQQHQQRPRRPSLLHNQQIAPDKHHGYFGGAGHTTQTGHQDYGIGVPAGDAIGAGVGKAAADGQDDDVNMLVVTPSLEAARGAEIEAAIHLATIATGGRPGGSSQGAAGNHTRGGIYVTTSSNTSVPRPEALTAANNHNRSLRPMGSHSDHSSYGTAPSLVTEASTYAESSSGGSIGGSNLKSPPDSNGVSTDDTSETSPPISFGDTHDNHHETDGNNSSNGTGKYFCTVCQKRFTRPSALAVHSHMHTGAKPFGCQICNR